MLFLKCAVMYWNYYLKLFLYQPPTNSTQFEMFIVLLIAAAWFQHVQAKCGSHL